MTTPPVSIAILAGGRSTRYPGGKAMVRFDGEALYERAVRVFSPLTDDIFFQLREDQVELIGAVEELCRECEGLGICFDQGPGLGPLNGILCALESARHPYLFVMGVDMPNIDGRILEALAGAAGGGGDIVVPTWSNGMMEPLCAMYSKDIAGKLAEILKVALEEDGGDCATRGRNCNLGLQRTIRELRDGGTTVVELSVEEFMGKHGLDGTYFANVNTPGDGG